MKTQDNKNSKMKIGKTILIVLLVVFVIRSFLVDSYTITNSQMNTALVDGDKVFVDKTSYGIRMPITPLAIPFVFDTFLGGKSYSTLIHLPHVRVDDAKVYRNDVIFYNSPIEREKPIDRRSLNMGRCVGLPGDSLEYKDGHWMVNDAMYTHSPDEVSKYVIEQNDSTMKFNEDLVYATLQYYNIPKRAIERENNKMYLELSRYEALVYNNGISNNSYKVSLSVDYTLSYSLVVPYAGFALSLTENNRILYGDCIIDDSYGKVQRNDNELVRDGEKLEEYTFEGDMHWILNDNTMNTNDSRSFGFVPISHIVGRVSYVWYASDKRTASFERSLKRGEKNE